VLAVVIPDSWVVKLSTLLHSERQLLWDSVFRFQQDSSLQAVAFQYLARQIEEKLGNDSVRIGVSGLYDKDGARMHGLFAKKDIKKGKLDLNFEFAIELLVIIKIQI
jgi:hypothetical protein